MFFVVYNIFECFSVIIFFAQMHQIMSLFSTSPPNNAHLLVSNPSSLPLPSPLPIPIVAKNYNFNVTHGNEFREYVPQPSFTHDALHEVELNPNVLKEVADLHAKYIARSNATQETNTASCVELDGMECASSIVGTASVSWAPSINDDRRLYFRNKMKSESSSLPSLMSVEDDDDKCIDEDKMMKDSLATIEMQSS